MTDDTKVTNPCGIVYLVGAGPGDPGLITVKGLNLLRCADVIAYDRLAPSALLTEARPDAELINVGKMPQKQRLDQNEINTLLIDRAKAGKTVVRLKGGDPFVFGRGGEEVLACHAAGVPCVVVPGVSSAIAVPAYAGVPVTHRHVSRAFAVVTGHEDTEGANVDYGALVSVARIGTLVILMGVSHMREIIDQLIAAGLDPDTPAICIEWGTTDHQRVVEGTAATLTQLAIDADLKPPSTTVIGAAVALRSQGLNWFDDGI
jgi:uroporphyrin-III C-methyltransferase